MTVEMKTNWFHCDLPTGMYSASVDPYGKYFMFRAYPDRGDMCVEGIYDTKEEACEAGARFAAGETNVKGLYSSFF